MRASRMSESDRERPRERAPAVFARPENARDHPGTLVRPSSTAVPSFTLLAQSVLSGIFVGGLYGLLGLGLSLSWGLLRLINLAHFALAFLGAYLTYTLSSAFGIDPLWSLALVPPAFFGLGVLSQLLFARFGVTQFGSLLVTFGLTVMIESLIQWIWTADYRRLETAYGTASWRVGPPLRSEGRAARPRRRRDPGRPHLGVAPLHVGGEGAPGLRGGRADRRRVRGEPPAPGPRALGSRRRLRRRGRRLRGADLHAGARPRSTPGSASCSRP